jgi:hypothetical protein
MTDEMRQARIKQNLMGREGEGWDVGYGEFLLEMLWYVYWQRPAILFLCSKEAKWITGVCLPVDAGVSFHWSGPQARYMTLTTWIRLDHGWKVRQTRPESRQSGGKEHWNSKQQIINRKGLRISSEKRNSRKVVQVVYEFELVLLQ